MEKIKLILIPYMKWKGLDAGLKYTVKFVLGLGLIMLVLMLQGCKIIWDKADDMYYLVEVNQMSYFTAENEFDLSGMEFDLRYPCAKVRAVDVLWRVSDPAVICLDDL